MARNKDGTTESVVPSCTPFDDLAGLSMRRRGLPTPNVRSAGLEGINRPVRATSGNECRRSADLGPSNVRAVPGVLHDGPTLGRQAIQRISADGKHVPRPANLGP